MASRSRRSPADRPPLASSARISAAEPSSSAPPGGCTGPLAALLSASKPCLGAACWAPVRPRLDAARARVALAFARLDAGGLAVAGLRAAPSCPRGRRRAAAAVPCPVVLAARAAARRGLERCGRERGRFARTLFSSPGSVVRPSLCSTSLTATSSRTQQLGAPPRTRRRHAHVLLRRVHIVAPTWGGKSLPDG